MKSATIDEQKAAEPFLLRFATPRSCETRDMAGHYCEQRQLWMIDVDGVSRPIVEEAAGMLAQTHTKTMTQVESDDDDQGRGAMAETKTITEVKQEADDHDASLMLPEIQTKTDVQQESDDQAVNFVEFLANRVLILLATNRRDVTTDFIVLELERRGIEFFRLNTEEIHTYRTVLPNGDPTRLRLWGKTRNLELGKVKGAYYRRPMPPEFDGYDPATANYLNAEWLAI